MKEEIKNKGSKKKRIIYFSLFLEGMIMGSVFYTLLALVAQALLTFPFAARGNLVSTAI